MATLTSTGCANRRQRLLELLAESRLDAAVITDVRDCYYFTGTLVPDDLPIALVFENDGNWSCVGPAEFDLGCGDVAEYEWNYRGTRNPDPVGSMIAACDSLKSKLNGKNIGIQLRSLLAHVGHALLDKADKHVSLDNDLASMQQRKDADELDVMRACVRANLAAYSAVSAAIVPGATELDVLAAGKRGAMLSAGEKVFHDGDYQSGSYNGPARDRPIEVGELYIVDAWTRYHAYWADMSRTFVVGSQPTAVQQALFDHIRGIQNQVPQLLRPGVDGRAVYRQLDEMVRQHPPLAAQGLIHHAGHAIGLRIHEIPDLNSERGGLLQAGNVVCVEPGGYFPAARHGVRLENMYLITEDGCEDLCPGEIELTVCG